MIQVNFISVFNYPAGSVLLKQISPSEISFNNQIQTYVKSYGIYYSGRRV